MKDRGYIYIISIFVVIFLSTSMYFMYSYSMGRGSIQKNRLSSVKSDYICESYINLVVSDPNYESLLKEAYYSKKTDEIILKKDITIPDSKLTNLSVKFNESRNLATLKCSSSYKNIPSTKILEMEVANEFYSKKSGYIDSSNLKSEKLPDLKALFKENYTEDKNFINLEGDFYIGKINNQKCIYEKILFSNGEEDFEDIKVIKEVNDYVNIRLVSGNLYFDNSTSLNAFYHIDGNLYTYGNDLSGIVYLGENSSVDKLSLSGYLVNPYDVRADFNITKNDDILRRYSNILPDYIKFKPISLKSVQ